MAATDRLERSCWSRLRSSGFVSLAIALVGLGTHQAVAQVGVPGAAQPAPPARPDPSQRVIPAKDNPGAVFAATSGPIRVAQQVNDADIRATLDDLLTQYPGVRAVTIHVRDGVVKLDGHADDDDTINQVTDFTKKVEGVRLVLNKMQTDAEVLSGRQLAAKVLADFGGAVAQNWMLAVVAVAFCFGFGMLARAFAASSETVLGPVVRNPLLRSVIGSILSSVIGLGGVVIALNIMHWTHAVTSVLGLAGVVGLAVGFAFRDIVENFIASMLLGLRRPFGIGDFITVAGRSGSVLALDTRATTLITPEGNHVRIPNAVIYKETLVNASAMPSTLGAIDVTVPYEASTADALAAMNDTLAATEGLIQEPTPRALVAALETTGVRLRATYWFPSKGLDGDKLQSDLRLRIKVALQQAGITPPSTDVTLTVAGRVPIELVEAVHALAQPGRAAAGASPILKPDAGKPALPRPKIAIPHDFGLSPAHAADEAELNLRKDVEAAATANTQPVEAQDTPIDHAIRQAEAEARAEGNNMLVNGRAK